MTQVNNIHETDKSNIEMIEKAESGSLAPTHVAVSADRAAYIRKQVCYTASRSFTQ